MPNFEVGDIVRVKGYGGFATVLVMEEDGVTPQGHTKWLCTVRFGPYENQVGYVPFGPVRKGVRDRVHQFYSGKLKNIYELDEDADDLDREIAKLKKGPSVSAEAAAKKRQDKLKAIELEIALLEASS